MQSNLRINLEGNDHLCLYLLFVRMGEVVVVGKILCVYFLLFMKRTK